MWLRALLVGGLLAGLLSACAVVDPVDNRYDTVGRSLAKARDQAIFLNLIRASHNYPLAFTTIANVTPTMTNTTSFALPSFSIGPPNCLPTLGPTGALTSRACSYLAGTPGASTGFNNSTASNATAVSTNFSVSTEETGSFYQGFLKPIDLQILNYFLRQGYPRELLFWLFADSFQFQVGPSVRNALGYEYNPPDSYGCPRDRLARVPQLCFRDWIWAALLSGLTVEEKTILKSGGGGSSKGGGSDSGGASKGAEATTVTRFCFSPFLQRQAVNEIGQPAAAIRPYMPFSLSMIRPDQLCGNWSDAAAERQMNLPQGDTFKLVIGPYTFRIVPRSAYGVFEFLGNLLKLQEGNSEAESSAFVLPPRDGLPPVTELPPTLLTEHDEPLITVLRESGPNCFSHTWFYDGDYCVPQSATSTKRIFSLLSQLIAIETTATDLSFTPVVRVIQ